MKTMRERSIGIRPAFELHGRMKHVMDAMDGDWRVLADQIENAFDEQQILTRAFSPPCQPGCNGVPGQRLVTGDDSRPQMPLVWACSV